LSSPHVTVVLPAYNEEKHIESVARLAMQYADRVIVIDNCSTDQTYERAKSSGAIVLRHCVNLGKAASMKTGCEAAIKLGTDYIAFMDSDGQHKPEDVLRCVHILENEDVDIVIGGRIEKDNMPLVRKWGNLSLKILTHLIFNVAINDIQSGFRVFRVLLYDKIKWVSTGKDHYFADAEITCRIGMHQIKYKEIDIETIFFDNYKGMTFLEGLRLLKKIFIWRFTL